MEKEELKKEELVELTAQGIELGIFKKKEITIAKRSTLRLKIELSLFLVSSLMYFAVIFLVNLNSLIAIF